jgi:negative regulator of sigma E activity
LKVENERLQTELAQEKAEKERLQTELAQEKAEKERLRVKKEKKQRFRAVLCTIATTVVACVVLAIVAFIHLGKEWDSRYKINTQASESLQVQHLNELAAKFESLVPVVDQLVNDLASKDLIHKRELGKLAI